MIVLSRKKNESLVIGSDIVVTVVEIRGDKVRLGVVHPKHVPVHREEVYEAVHGHPPAEPRAVGPATATARSPAPPAVTSPAPTVACPRGPAVGQGAARPASLLDRFVAALEARPHGPATREWVIRAVAEAAVPELAADAVRSTPAEELKALLLEALRATR